MNSRQARRYGMSLRTGGCGTGQGYRSLSAALPGDPAIIRDRT